MYIFDNNETEQEFLHKGYAIQPLLNDHEVQTLAHLFYSLVGKVPDGYQHSFFSRDTDYKRRIDREIRSILENKFKHILPHYNLIVSGFVTKRAKDQQGWLGKHQDYSLVDQSMYTGINIWCPLTDVDVSNGCIQVVEGSHNVNHISTTPPNPTPFDLIWDLLKKEFLTPLPMKAGSILIFDARLLHLSDYNTSDRHRIAVLSDLIPISVTPRIYLWDKKTPRKLKVYEINLDFILQMEPNTYPEDPESMGAIFLESIDYICNSLKLEDFLELRRQRSPQNKHKMD